MELFASRDLRNLMRRGINMHRQTKGWMVGMLACSLLAVGACSTLPTAGDDAPQSKGASKSSGSPKAMVRDGFDAYGNRKYEEAITLFKNTQKAAGKGSSAYDKALIGEILIRLSADRKWRDLDRAEQILAELRSGSSKKASGADESQLLMNALNNLVIAEKDNAELRRKLDASYAQLSRLEKEKVNLNNALNKLRSLTLD